MGYTVPQIIGILSYPISIGSLLLGSISWHYHHKENILDSLTVVEKLRLAPFFVVIIVTKIWVMADASNTLHWATEIILETDFFIQNPHQLPFSVLSHFITLLPIIIAISNQLYLHKKTGFSFKESCLGSLANTVSLGRPTLDESQNSLVSILYCRETWMSSIYYLILPALCVTLKYIYPAENYQIWTSYTSVALSVSYILVTKVYTKYFLHIIFPVEDTSHVPSDVTAVVPTVLATTSTATQEEGSSGLGQVDNGGKSNADEPGNLHIIFSVDTSHVPSNVTTVVPTVLATTSTATLEEGSSGLGQVDNGGKSNADEPGKAIQILDPNTRTDMGKRQKKLVRKISHEVIKEDRWVRIFATVATITIIVITISIGFLVQPHTGKNQNYAEMGNPTLNLHNTTLQLM